MTEDETVRWHHRLHGHEFEQAPGDGEGQGGLACCSPWDRRESDTTEPLNNSDQAPLSRQEYWSGLPCLPPGDLPDPGIEPNFFTSPALLGRFFTISTTWEATVNIGIS